MHIFSGPKWYFYVARPRWLTRVIFQRRITNYLPPSPFRLLDIGCGPGSNAFLFEYSDYLGIDIDYRRVHFARRLYPSHPFSVGDATALPLATNSVDVVLACGLLHHLSDPMCEKLFRECRRIIKGQGQVLIIEPALTERRSPLNFAMTCIDLGRYLRPISKTLAFLDRLFRTTEVEVFFQPPLYRCALVAARPEPRS